MLKKDFQQLLKNSILPIILIAVGSFVWLFTMVRSGLCWEVGCRGGIGFWGANGHDALWHLSLINNFANGNFGNPVFAGHLLQNYHIGFDLILSWIVRLTGISGSILYFQIIPPILAALVGLLTYKFVYIWRGSRKEAFLSTFFVYFGGSFGFFVSLFRGQGLGGESMFWSMQSISTLINPPFALSLVFILLGLISLIKYQKKKKLVSVLLAVLCFGLLSAIKIYASLLVLAALLAVGIYLLITKRELLIIKVLIGVLTISLLLYIPLNGFSGGNLIVLKPFWFLESMMALSDRVGWHRFYSAMTTYRMGDVWVKGTIAYLSAFVIFIVGNFGTRILSLMALKGKIKNIKDINMIGLFTLVIVLAGIVVPTFFVQKGTAWNTIQFLYYSLFFASIASGIVLGSFIEKSKVSNFAKYALVVFIVLLTIPTTISSIKNYVGSPQSVLPKNEMEALAFLKNESSGVVLTYPYQKGNSDNPPTPLYLYTTTAYVSAFSGKPVFLEDEMNLGIMQYAFDKRRESIESFLNTLDEKTAYEFLRDNNITYVYWLKGQRAIVGDKQLGLAKIFENEDATIFRVNE